MDEIDRTDPSFTPPWLAEKPRIIAPSLPSQYELDSERKSSPPVLERRKQLTRVVASAVGVAWFICLVAVGQGALRAVLTSLHDEARAAPRREHRIDHVDTTTRAERKTGHEARVAIAQARVEHRHR